MGGLARRASAQMPASAGLSCIVVRSARGLPDLEPDVGGRVAPDPPLRAVPEDAEEGAFEVVDVGDAGNGVLQAGPPSLADLTPGEQVEAPPSRPRDDRLDPPRGLPSRPAPQAPDREDRRPQRDGHPDVHGKQPPRSPTPPSFSKPLQYAPCTGPTERGSAQRRRVTRVARHPPRSRPDPAPRPSPACRRSGPRPGGG